MRSTYQDEKHLRERVLTLEARIADSGDKGRIWPDVSKAVKEGKEKTSIMVLRGVHANPRMTLNVYPSQFARLLAQLPTIVEGVLAPGLWDRLSFRNDEEKKSTKAFLTAYLGELKGGDA